MTTPLGALDRPVAGANASFGARVVTTSFGPARLVAMIRSAYGNRTVGRGHSNHWILDSLRGAPPRRPGWITSRPDQKDRFQASAVIARRAKPDVAISWYCVRLRTFPQEIAAALRPRNDMVIFRWSHLFYLGNRPGWITTRPNQKERFQASTVIVMKECRERPVCRSAVPCIRFPDRFGEYGNCGLFTSPPRTPSFR